MPKRPLQNIGDQQGGAKLGWLEPGVFYLELSGSVSAALAEQSAARLGAFLDGTSKVHVFLDSSALRGCDRFGKSALVRAFMAHRQCITRIIILSSPDVRRSHGPCMWTTFGELVEYVFVRSAFAARLLQLAPSAPQEVDGLLPPPADGESAPRSAATSSVRRLRGSSHPARGGVSRRALSARSR